MSRLRIASPGGDAPEGGFADTARAALEHVLARGAVVLTIIYETPGNAGWVSVPQSEAVARGLVHMAADVLDPDVSGAE